MHTLNLHLIAQALKDAGNQSSTSGIVFLITCTAIALFGALTATR